MVKMKDSGIEWCGQIPEHWKVMPNKYVMFKKKEICPIYTGQDILSLTMGGVIVRDLDAGGKMPTTFNGYQKVHPNNLLMCLFDYDVTPRCIGLIKNEGLTSPAYSQFVMKDENDSRYYYFYYLMIDHTKELLHLAKNLRHSFTEEQLGTINTPVPPVNEQRKIADFLDKKCNETDKLYSDIQKQIEILEEYKKSVITEIVTKGLNPDVEMKDSGVEWIGKIPKDWNLNKIKYLFENRKGLSITKDNLIDDGLPVVSYGQIHSKINTGVNIKSELLRFVDFSYLSFYPQCEVFKYDFIFADTSEDYEGCGNCVYKRDDGILFAGYHSIILHSKLNQDNRYFAYLFKTDCWRKQLREVASGVKLFSISQKSLINSSVIVPSFEEQQEIADYLDEKCTVIDELIKDKKEQLEVLEQYKKSLIYEYVTGKKTVTEEE